jgi:AraC-like DNA-binding protein
MIIGVVGGRLPVFASVNLFQSNSSANVSAGDYCHLYEKTLANDLHVSTSALEQANKDALQQTIDQLAKDRKLTAAEQMALQGALQLYGSDPCTNLPRAASALMSNPAVKQQLAAIHTKLVQDVAQALQLVPSTLEYELSQGKTIAQIAREQDLPVSVANRAYLASVKSILAQFVRKQDITQEQADWLYTLAAQAVSAGHYPLLELK